MGSRHDTNRSTLKTEAHPSPSLDLRLVLLVSLACLAAITYLVMAFLG